MEFKDWRKSAEKPTDETDTARRRIRGRQYRDYIEEQIREAQERGAFDNLPGMGKPLNLDLNPYVGDKAMGYGLLKSNGYAPKEIELAREIRTELERVEARLERVRHQSNRLRSRRIPPFASEKRAFNKSVEEMAVVYEDALRGLNRKILTLNLTTPQALHQPLLDVAKRVQDFRESCPLFD